MARPRTTTDEALLTAAGRAIGRHGPAGLTLAAVAAEAGVSPATLVQRFGSKRGLLLAVAERAARDTAAPFDEARRAHRSPLAALTAALAAMAEPVRSPEELAGHLGFLQLDLTDPQFREHATRATTRMREEIAALLADAVSAGELGPDAAVGRLARAVQVTYNGALITWALTGEGDLATALRADLDHLLKKERTA
ncbi:TetR/AcrR family transcriptional regulator [Actinomadura macrotermitis]|uniref:HTH tetR-type domain-containing protein n=1 Tax=Actinomadura macrotermitis TaxID=2585200 RepID=A0A7K0BVR6_9ACTN|nr:TetR/AcrR family transcriptional regulator [Actinomadura macrotermitis]MQY05166.1 hypothetical protein [Actinomadura macrotermitis]